MTIQFDHIQEIVRIGDMYLSATSFPTKDFSSMFGIGYTIPLGHTGRTLSVAVGGGTYSDHHDMMKLEIENVQKQMAAKGQIEMPNYEYLLYDEMETVEWGYKFTQGFEVKGYVNDKQLLLDIQALTVDPDSVYNDYFGGYLSP